MIDRLERLYSKEDAEKAKLEIEKLAQKYQKLVHSGHYDMSEKDVILITYGDQVVKPGEEPLATLKNFLDDYAKEVISTVHILPFYPYSSDDGFSVIDYKDVSPRMGSWRDVERLRENYRLMFDGVINHISQYSFWFKSFLANDEKYANFFTEVEPSVDLSKVVRPRTLPLIHEYEDLDHKLRYVWTTFSKDQVDLNYANYKVLVAVLDALLFYVQKGATLIRLDAIAFVWKEIGTSCIHLPQTHELIQLMREVIHLIAPEVIIITETNVPHDENISYFGTGENEAQMVYNFALPPLIAHSILKGDCRAITNWANTLSLPSDKVCFFNFTASHDGCGVRPVTGLISDDELSDLVQSVEDHGGFVSYRTNDSGTKSPYELNASYIDIISDPKEETRIRVRKMILAQAVSLAMPGVPGVYFHSFVGSTSDVDGVKRSGVFRSINREKFNYDNLVSQMNEAGNLRTMIYRSYKQLLFIRKSEKAFNPYAAFEFIDLDERLFIIRKIAQNGIDEVLAVHNFSDKSVISALPDFVEENAVELLKNEKIIDNKIKLKPYQVMWIKYTKENK
ncbi:MAG: sugar phosphorylase [Epsilonproteobacteria bacterium]|nr:sugar phosphorylase [Campylobacterota bacterium]